MTAHGRASVYALVEKGARDLLLPNRWCVFAPGQMFCASTLSLRPAGVNEQAEKSTPLKRCGSAGYIFLTKRERRGYCSGSRTSGINLRLIDLPLFCLLPELHPFLQTIRGEFALLGADQGLHVLEAALKLAVGGAQGLLGVDVEHTRDLRDDEEDIAHFVHLLLWRGSRAQFVQFLAQFVQHLLQARKLKACPRGPFLILLGLEQRGQG